LGENKFDIAFKGIPKIIFITFVILLFLPLSIIEIIFSPIRLRKTRLKKSPIFLLGHWRNGTTFLHELMNCNPEYEYMSISESVFPNLTLYFSKLIRRVVGWVLPDTRPQDDVKINADFPSEHDFAIANQNAMSPYLGGVFPKNQDYYNRYASFFGVSDKEKNQLKRDILNIIKKLSIKKNHKRLVLKSPIDTARVDLLLDIFPDAKFIHIYRNPYKVFFSTKRMHLKLVEVFHLQNGYPDLDEFILKTYRDIYYKYYSDIHLIPPGNLIEIKYEELVENPLKEVERIYKELSLSGFEKAEPHIKKYLEKVENYTTNTYSINQQDKERIYSYWHGIIDTMGYEKPGSIVQLG
jgi:hypothetical protein